MGRRMGCDGWVFLAESWWTCRCCKAVICLLAMRKEQLK